METCNQCGYPPRAAGDACDNPACFANPNVSERQKAAWRESNRRIKEDQQERQRIADIRKRMGTYG